jgi:hypothetical protein
MLIVFFYVKRIVHREFVPPNTVVNCDFTVEFETECHEDWSVGSKETGGHGDHTEYINLFYFLKLSIVG